jgi:serine/threonine-protein kinase PknG
VATPPDRRQVTRPSVLFGSMTEPLHGGLGAIRPLHHWITAHVTEDSVLAIPEPFTTPTATEVAAALPAPLADPDDPRSAGLTEGALADCRAALRRGAADAAQKVLDDAHLPRWHWLRAWYEGVIALVRADVQDAADRFTVVRAALPGELIPRLALGLCFELCGDMEVARLHYETVFDTAPALGAAAFGVARVHALTGRRREAVDTVERLAREFRFEREARIAAVRLLVAVPPPTALAAPTPADLAEARELAALLELRAEIQHAEFVMGGDQLKLSEVIREIAGYAPAERDHTALVNLANRTRPPIEWRWPRILWPIE